MAERFKNPPLKRHPSLQPLSRDHYQGLVVAQHLIKSADGDVDAQREAVGEFLEAYGVEIDQHFRDEERLLPPHMTDAQRRRFEQEHERLRRLAGEAQEQVSRPDSEWVRSVGEALEAHIRWEERELFPAIEQQAGAEALQGLAPEAEAIEASRPRSACRPPGKAEEAGGG